MNIRFCTWEKRVAWIHLTQDRKQRILLVNTAMNEEWCLLGCYAVWLASVSVNHGSLLSVP
jgi:hypothetical protein